MLALCAPCQQWLIRSVEAGPRADRAPRRRQCPTCSLLLQIVDKRPPVKEEK